MDLVSRELQQVVSEIRNIPGYTDFLAEPTLSQIQVVGLTTPLAYLMTTPMGGLILLVAHDSLQTIWLDKVTDNMVEEWLTDFNKVPTRDSWLGAYQNWLDERTRQSFQTWTEMIDIVTSQLWTHVMRPLAESLRKLMPPGNSIAPPVTLIPTGLLALLPLHAAWTPDSSTPTGRHYFLDEFTVNYAPSALALNNSRKGAENRMPERLLAIEEPLARGRSRLHSVHAEVAAISELFDKRLLLARRRATREAVLAALPQADVVHFACHGSHDWENALNSGLLMADDEKGNNVALSVLDLLAAERSQIRLVVLSACDTGIVGTKLPDEAIALPIAFLQADCCGVLASLWSVSDLSTAMLMQYFYARWRADNLSPAQALRAAQRWLRDATNEEKAEYFTRYIAEQLGSRAPHSATIEFSSEMVSRSLDARDFASPYF
jgi:CHAT domain-containing protein